MVPVGTSTTARVQVRCSDNIFYNISAEDFEIQVTSGPTFLLNLPNPLSTICAGDVESNIPVMTSVISGFPDNVTLSATNLPGSSSLIFDSPIIAAGLGTTFEISNTAGLAEGNYTITITGTSGVIVRNLDFVLTVEEFAGTTTLDLPADNEVDVGLFPNLSWMPKSNATSYDVQVSQDPTFVSLVVNETVSTNSYSLNVSLVGLTVYYWRARGTTSCGNTPWSVSREFTTKDCAAAFIQNTPVSISSSGTPEVNSVFAVTGSGTVDGIVVSNIIGTHSYVGDLTVQLIGPGGTPTVLLWSGECGSSNDFSLSFSDSATDPVGSTLCNPFGQGGIFVPENLLSAFDGLPIAGNWTLNINDNANQDGGELLSWGLEFCSGLNPLPVELLSFDVTGQKNAIQLEWKTANEYNNAGFEIERLAETETEFTTIGEVLATDDVRQVNNYQYLDEDVRPDILYYYRLRQNDFDGQFEYSQIRTAIIEDSEFVLQVYPSPVHGELFGVLNVDSDFETELRLYDLNGRIVKEQIASGNQFVMNLAGLPSGLYVLKARHDRGRGDYQSGGRVRPVNCSVLRSHRASRLCASERFILLD
jgi:subtilisin-like proprotein convertase family protein